MFLCKEKKYKLNITKINTNYGENPAEKKF